MNNYFKKIPQDLKKVIRAATQVSRETKMPAYLVGGSVRDLILQMSNLDLDIAIEGNGIFFAQELARKLKATFKIHQRFKTATLILTNGLKVDVATTRQEKYPYSAALPVVRPGSLSEDLKRRDFTINALAIILAKGRDQKIIDPYGGCADLALRVVRILHNLSFKDDPTRIFRAIRFSQRFNFKIETKTLVLLKEAILAGALDKVSDYRMCVELVAILKEPNPFWPIKQLNDLGALSFISNKLKINRFMQSRFNAIASEIVWYVKNFPKRRPLDIWLIYFAGLLEPLTLPAINTLISRLGLSKREQKIMISYFKLRKKIIAILSRSKVKPEQIFLLLEPLSHEAIILLSAVSKNKNFKRHLKDFFKIYNGMRPCISGHDLISMGVKPGPEYRKILAMILTAKLNGQVKNRQAELVLVKKLVKDR